MGMWYANERVAAEPYDDGNLTDICVVNWTEKEQDWKGAIHTNCYNADYLYIIYVVSVEKMEFTSFYFQGLIRLRRDRSVRIWLG